MTMTEVGLVPRLVGLRPGGAVTPNGLITTGRERAWDAATGR